MFVLGLTPRGLQTRLKPKNKSAQTLGEKGIVSQNKSPARAAKITQLYSTPKHVSLQLGCHTRKRKCTQSQTGP